MVKYANREIIYLSISDLSPKTCFRGKVYNTIAQKQEKRYEQGSGPLYPEPYTSVK